MMAGSIRRLIIAAIVLTVAGWPVGVGAATHGTGNWPMFGDGPAQNSDNRVEATLNPGNVSGLTVLNTYSNWYPSILLETQAIVGNLGYSVVNTGSLAAYKLPSGTEAWHHRIYSHNNYWNYSPAVQSGRIFVGGDTAMYAFNATTGQQLWKFDPNGSEAVMFNQTTIAPNGTVYAATYETGTVYAFNPTNGHVLWSTVPGSCCYGPVSISGTTAYVAGGLGLYAMNAATGGEKFNVAAGGIEDVAISGGVAFAETTDTVQAYNAATGAHLWTSATAPGDDYSSLAPAVDGNTVVVVTPQYVFAYNATTGAQLWSIDSGADNTDYAAPSIANGVVYAGSLNEGLQAIDEATGAILYSGSSGCDNPVISNGRVFVPCGLGETVFGL
jgi:outer membrane protein assembly factor BamB